MCQGPVVRCAAQMGIRAAIHGRKQLPGVTNKLLAPDVDIVFAAVPAAVEKLGAPQKTVVVGNPVRPEVFAEAPAAHRRPGPHRGRGADRRSLSFGGSLGAQAGQRGGGKICVPPETKDGQPVLHLHALPVSMG